MTTSTDLGAWLRRQREDRRWTRTEMARRLIRAATTAGDTAMPSAANLTHNLYRWERGDNGISERYRLYCSEILGIPPRRFGAPATPAQHAQPAGGDKIIVIMITLPDGIDAHVRVARPGNPPGPRTAD